jgi:hypothetical protein
LFPGITYEDKISASKGKKHIEDLKTVKRAFEDVTEYVDFWIEG